MRLHIRGTRAQALVELALVLPLIVAIICSIFEFSWAFFNVTQLEHAVIAGARSGILGASDAEIQELVTKSSARMPISTVAIVIRDTDGETYPADTRMRGLKIRVTAQLTYKSLTPIFEWVGENDRLNFVRSAEETMER